MERKIEAGARARSQKMRTESLARMAAAQAQVCTIVAMGKCADCGGGLRRNLSLTGWWQCEQFGAVGFRKDAMRPACNWQGFTD